MLDIEQKSTMKEQVTDVTHMDQNEKIVEADQSSINKVLGKSTSLEAEWENLEKTKLQLRHQLDKFSQDREQLEKDLIEFKTCKEAHDKAHQL